MHPLVLIWCSHLMRASLSSWSRCLCVCVHGIQCIGMLTVFPSNNGPSWQPAGSLTSDRKQCIFISVLHTPTHKLSAFLWCAAIAPYGRLVKARAFTFIVLFPIFFTLLFKVLFFFYSFSSLFHLLKDLLSLQSLGSFFR